MGAGASRRTSERRMNDARARDGHSKPDKLSPSRCNATSGTRMSVPSDRMSPEERRVGASLASIFALRMLGLFLILPVFSVYAKTLPGGDDLALIGFALGAYGLTQAVFQIPYGVASDYFGRKQVIVFGLIVFALGSFVAAWGPDMTWIIIGRVLQGAGG